MLSPVVQRILNRKISQRFPTAVTLMDLVFYVLVIAFFQASVTDSLKARAGKKESMDVGLLVPLYIAVFYFSVREVVQALSLASLGLFNTWVSDLENWLDVVYILLILFWSIVMTVEGMDQMQFQNGAAISLAVFWMMILIFLQSIIVGFAVFVGGVIYVLKRLAAFIFTLAIILVAFMQIFYTLYKQSGECDSGSDKDNYTDSPGLMINCHTNPDTGELYGCNETISVCEPTNEKPFCNRNTSFFKIFTMLLGQVDENFFRGNVLATLLYCLFMFACVIILANVLIAIVTDSYSVIQNERSGMSSAVQCCPSCSHVDDSRQTNNLFKPTFMHKQQHSFSGQTGLISSQRWTSYPTI